MRSRRRGARDRLVGEELLTPVPDVCEDLGVPWMRLPQFVDAQGWTLTLR